VAALALGATTLVVAAPASASCNAECKEQKEQEKEQKEHEKQEAKELKAKEKQEAAEQKQREKTKAKQEEAQLKEEEQGIKEEEQGKFSALTWTQYEFCEFENPEASDCFTGITNGGKNGGFFQYGHIKVPLSKPIRLQGSFKGAGSEVELYPAVNGGETLEAPELPVEGGLKVITQQIQEATNWPAALRQSYSAAVKNHEGQVFVKIELAGTELFEVPGSLDTENIIFEEGVAFRLPLKVKVTGPWLNSLGGTCLLGSDAHPIMQHLTTEGAGRAGEIAFNKPFTNTAIIGSQLVDVGWHIEEASGATGCGGPENEEFLDAALNRALEVQNPVRRGITELTGSLFDGAAPAIRHRVEKGLNP
jgi:hypothetical protein